MKIVANLGKLTEGKTLILIEKAGRYEYVICRNFDPETESWASGEYYYDLESLAKGILYYTQPVNYDRMSEIATVALHGLVDNDCLDELDDIDLEEDEKEYFFS